METPYYIHRLDPVLLDIAGPLAIRWYGLAYLAGFLVVYLVLQRWGRRGEFRVEGPALQSLLMWLVAGVMRGGRIGYMLLYDFAHFAQAPWILFQVWKGGMASHGGMVGLAVAMALFARRQKVPLLHLTDAISCVAPFGLFFGRVANFINGELWGRASTVPWAVIFPQSAPHEGGLDASHPHFESWVAHYLEQGLLQPRHPSQLYQALLEGLLLALALLALRRTAWARTPGRLSGAFLGLYGLARIGVEAFREPEIVHFGWMTQGQLLSLAILLPAAAWLLLRSRRDRGDKYIE